MQRDDGWRGCRSLGGEMEEWYWCLRHRRAEQGAGCRADDRLGPYDSKDEAENYAERVKSRNDHWDAEDRRWTGD